MMQKVIVPIVKNNLLKTFVLRDFERDIKPYLK